MHRESPFLAGVLTLALIFVLGVTLSATDVKLIHQGRLLDADDAPISGTVTLTFRIFETPTGGAPLWSETQAGVTVADGLFTTTLGSFTPLSSDVLTPSAMAPDHWLEVEVNGAVISPRLALGAVPSAAVSTRISGDLESKLGHLGLLGASSLSRMDLDDHDDSTGIVISGADGRIIVVKHRLEPHEARLALGDLNRDGFADITTSPESTTMLLADSSSAGSASISSKVHGDLALQRLGGSILIHGDDGISSGGSSLHADVDSASSVLSLSDGSTTGTVAAKVNRSGDTMTGDLILNADPFSTVKLHSSLIESSINMIDDRDLLGLRSYSAVVDKDSARVVLSSDSDGDGIAAKKIGLYIADQGSAMECSSDIDEDGIPDQEIVSKITPTLVQHAVNTKGTGAQIGRMAAVTSVSLDTASFELDADGDGDGHKESRVHVKVTPIDGIDHGAALLSLGSDSDDDGDDECAAGIATGDKFAQVRGFKVDIDGLNRNSFESSCDSASARIIVDRDTGRSKGFMRVSPEGPSIGLDHEFSQVFDVSTPADSTRMTVKSAGGFGMLQGMVGNQMGRLHLSAGGSESLELSVDESSGPGSQPSSKIRLGNPLINELTLSANSDAVKLSATHDSGTGVLDGAELSASGIDSYVHLVDDGITVYRVSSSSGMEIRDASSSLTSSIDLNGNGYLASKLGVGTTATHHIDVVGGAYCDGSNWVNASDKNVKENFKAVDGEELLDKIAELAITEWNYKADKDAKHIGPTAQDFKKAFGLGKDDKSISTIDPSGIALAAIQELYLQIKQKDEEIASLRKSNASQIEDLKKELARLREEIKKN